MDDHEYDDQEYTVLNALRDILSTEESFYRITRFLDGRTRNHVVAAHLRNTHLMLTVLHAFTTRTPQTTRMVVNIPLDISGNFFDPIPVIPNQAQIRAATEAHIGVTDTVCSICQESVTYATRIRGCGHCFHASCIDQWFSMNPRCPVCRHDIREPQQPREPLSNTQTTTDNENRGMHSDEE